MKPIRYLFFLYLITLFACNNVPKEIVNTFLYADVINHYERIESNKEKKKAALFLFKNMVQKYSIFDFKTDSVLKSIMDSIEQKNIQPGSKDIIEILKNNSRNTTKPEITFDYSSIKSNELISHIDITFNSWKRLSEKSGATFNDYCEYILPYRLKDEPALSLSTKFLENDFRAFVDTLKSVDSIVVAISRLIKSFGCKLDLTLSNNYPLTFSPKQVFEF